MPRLLLILTAVVLVALTMGFAWQVPGVIALWPWAEGRLSYLFIASILAATAAPVLWIGVRGEFAALRAGALDFGVMSLGLGLSVWIAGPAAAEWIDVPIVITLCALAVVFNGGVFWWNRSVAFVDRRVIPGWVCASFGFYAVVLIAVGTVLVLRVPGVFPWPLTPASSVVFGWVFLGAAMYFLYALWYPYWGNACGQLLGFLAYDAVLLGPFLAHFESVGSEWRMSLIVYTALIVYSALLSGFFLFVHPGTRFFSEK